MRQIFGENHKWVLIRVDSCESENIGEISDQIMQEKNISLCVAYCQNSSGCKFNVRSDTDEARANEVAAYLAESVGAGGGQSTKAGGFLSECLILAQRQTADYEGYFTEKLNDYFSQYQIVHSEEYKADLDQLKRYRKKKIKLGVVRTTDFLKEGTPILIRTLEGDMECVSAADLYIMIGIDGEVYPIREEKFMNSYEFVDGKTEFTGLSSPSIHNTITGEAYELLPYMKTCQARKEHYIFARQLTESTKVFTQWDKYKYLKGEKGDYIAVRI